MISKLKKIRNDMTMRSEDFRLRLKMLKIWLIRNSRGKRMTMLVKWEKSDRKSKSRMTSIDYKLTTCVENLMRQLRTWIMTLTVNSDVKMIGKLLRSKRELGTTHLWRLQRTLRLRIFKKSIWEFLMNLDQRWKNREYLMKPELMS